MFIYNYNTLFTMILYFYYYLKRYDNYMYTYLQFLSSCNVGRYESIAQWCTKHLRNAQPCLIEIT